MESLADVLLLLLAKFRLDDFGAKSFLDLRAYRVCKLAIVWQVLVSSYILRLLNASAAFHKLLAFLYTGDTRSIFSGDGMKQLVIISISSCALMKLCSRPIDMDSCIGLRYSARNSFIFQLFSDKNST
jgi:hypothetical protein